MPSLSFREVITGALDKSFTFETFGCCVCFLMFLLTLQGSDATFRTRLNKSSHFEILCLHWRSHYVSSSKDRVVHMPSSSICLRLDRAHFTRSIREKSTLVPSCFGCGDRLFSSSRTIGMKRFQLHAVVDVASAVDVINDLGLDTLTFLAVTVLIVPAFKALKASPVSSYFYLKLYNLFSPSLS